jgi:hypothetical protein
LWSLKTPKLATDNRSKNKSKATFEIEQCWIFAVLWWPFWKWRPVEIFRCRESIQVIIIYQGGDGQFGSLETSQSLDYNNILFILILSCIFTDISMRVQIISCQLSPLDVIYANFVLYFYRYIYESSDNFLSVISLGCYLY